MIGATRGPPVPPGHVSEQIQAWDAPTKSLPAFRHEPLNRFLTAVKLLTVSAPRSELHKLLQAPHGLSRLSCHGEQLHHHRGLPEPHGNPPQIFARPRGRLRTAQQTSCNGGASIKLLSDFFHAYPRRQHHRRNPPVVMSLAELRDLLPFNHGDNSSDTVINGVHFNLTALKHWNYTIYSNNTISNNSKCYLIFDNFKPHMFSNGSWVNATTCYVPYWGIKERGIASIAFGTLFGLSIMFTLINLRKHGKLHLREDRRFRVIGRRWQWYWMLFAAACGMISTITGIDVDRYYLQQIPIILQSFFFQLMVPAALAMVWEATRHWGSWQERQIVDVDPFVLPQDDKRAKTEFWLPLVFYLFAWLNFFMTIPRSWTAIQKQNTPEQKENIARPAATGAREKAGAILAVVAWLVMCYSLHHSLKWYKPRAVGFWNKINAFCRDCPTKLFVNIILLAIRLGYGIASAWMWELTIFNDDVAIGWPFGLGYGPILLMMIVFEIAGLVEENEDKVIISQRRARGIMHDQELGLVKKPSWWSRNWVERYKSDDQRLREMTTEVPGGRTSTRTEHQAIEMGNMNLRNRSRSRPPEDPFRDQSPESQQSSTAAAPARLAVNRTESDAASVNSRATALTGNTLTTENMEAMPPPRVRSMLDV